MPAIAGFGLTIFHQGARMVRFLHTSDWQLGMRRHFLDEGAQERYAQARFDAVRALGRVAEAEGCRFMLVCGDAFESNQVDRRTVARALEALRGVPVPVYLLPGNHDPLNEASVYRSATFLEGRPPHVHVIESAAPVPVAEGVELVGAPWLSRRPAVNPIQEALRAPAPAAGVVRVVAGHGAADRFTPADAAPGLIAVADLERAVAEGRAHFIALGDRHSLTELGAGGRIWYSGTPEATDFDEVRSGRALVVEVGPAGASAREVAVGGWRFVERPRVDLNAADDIAALRLELGGLEQKACTVVRLHLVGTLSLALAAALGHELDAARELFAAFEVGDAGLVVTPDDPDFADLGFSGFADATVRRLRERIEGDGEEGRAARDALMLLVRLAKEAV